jgi:2,3-bisphosphoglycerate-independent phosphoglycerate mutase
MAPVVFCILDGIGWRDRNPDGSPAPGDAVATARTPHLSALWGARPALLKAHGTAVGLPSDADMGNSEVGHNAFGAGRVIDQGASLVDKAIASGELFKSALWKELTSRPCIHFIGLISDGNVHSHIRHLQALLQAVPEQQKIRVHALTDGRDVSERSALSWIEPLEAWLADRPDAMIASGGGRMHITMDRYEADWEMVERGWKCHVEGQGRAFSSATEAIRALYAENPKVNDQWLPAFVVHSNGEPVGRIQDGDAVVLFNFRGDRAIEISRAFTEESFDKFPRGRRPDVLFAGMMQYDGDLKIPENYLVSPPVIDRTVPEALACAGIRSFVVSETQKYGHVTYFFNGNRSGKVSEALERYHELPSDRIPFDQAPAMKAREVTEAAIEALKSGQYQHIRLNLANGDMVGHTGNFEAAAQAVEVVDACVGRLVEACKEAGAVLIVTADHGNADEMLELDKKGKPIMQDGQTRPKTSHTLNPVPVSLVDFSGHWKLMVPEGAGIASLGATLLLLHGITPPADYLPGLVTR